jgi:hypothetical protein
MATATKRAMAREGNGEGGKSFGNYDSGGERQKGKWRERQRAIATQRGWRAFDSGNNGGGTKDTGCLRYD